MRRPQQQGQAIVLFALLSIVLVGFVGLVIDGGEVAAQQQLVQSAADGSALAGGYGVAQPGATVGSATTLAQNVLRNLGLAAGDLSIAFLDAGGGATTTPAAVKTVQATVSDSKPTFFLKVLGVNSTQVSARASAAAGAAQGCVLCILGSGTTVVEGVGAGITVSGGSAVIDSTASPNLLLNDNAHFSATSVTIAGGAYQLGQSATITPVPVLGNAVADPFAALPVPSVGGPVRSSTPPPNGSGSIRPGVYSGITVRGGYRLTLTPGLYVVTGAITVGGSATLSGSGVTIYLACDTYPTNCTNGGSGNCGSLTATGGQTTLSAPSSGTYSGVAVLADPGCMGTNDVNGGGLMVTGAFDTPAMTLLIETPNQAVLNSVVVVDNVSVSASATLSVSGSGGGGALGLSV